RDAGRDREAGVDQPLLDRLDEGAMLMLTVSFSTVTDPPPSPVRALTSSVWAARLAWTQASAKASLWTTLATWVRVKLWTPLAIGTARACSWAATWGRSPPRSVRAAMAWVVTPWTSMYLNTCDGSC